MTLPTLILSLLPASRVSFCTRSIHYQLRQAGQDVTLGLVEDTLRLMAARGEVEQVDDGWMRRERPVARQGGLFG